MRRLALALLVIACVLGAAGCGGSKEVSPTAETVETGVPTTETETTGTETSGEGETTGDEEAPPENGATTGETETGDDTETTGGGAGGAAGNATAGKEVYAAAGCGSCHAFEAAGSSGQVGPDLDESLEGKDAEYVSESIVDPSAEIADGFAPGIMPENYDEQLSDKELNDLVAFLSQ